MTGSKVVWTLWFSSSILLLLRATLVPASVTSDYPMLFSNGTDAFFSTNLTAVGHASLGITSTISGCASVMMVFTSVPLAAEYCRRQLPNVFVDWITTTITSTIAAAIIAVGGADIGLYSQGLATSLLIGLDAAVVVSFQSFKASVDIFSPGEVQDLFPLLDNQELSEDL